MPAGKGRGKPLTSCWHSPPPQTPSSPRASALQSSAAPSPPGSSGCALPPSPPPQRPLWNDEAPPAPPPPSSRPLACPSCSIAGGAHPPASPDGYGQLVSLFLPLLFCSHVRFSFHQILHLTGRKNREDGCLLAFRIRTLCLGCQQNRLSTPSNERRRASWQLCTLG